MPATTEGGQPRWVLLAEFGKQQVGHQADRVSEHRTRAATLFSAAAIAGGFLGSEAFSPAEGPGAWAWVGAVIFLLSGCLLAYVVWPRKWHFTLDTGGTLEYVKQEDLSIDEIYYAATLRWVENHRHNEPQILRLTVSVAAMGMLVVGELGAFFLDLALS